MDIYVAASQLGKFLRLATSTSVNNCYLVACYDKLTSKTRPSTLVPEVFLDFSSRKRSRASRETATTSCESDEERVFRNSLSLRHGLLLISFAKKNQEKPLGPGYRPSGFQILFVHPILSYSCFGHMKGISCTFFCNITAFRERSIKLNLKNSRENCFRVDCFVLASRV